MSERVSLHGQWSSRLVFVLAATGSAVGLGNVWKFPYIAGENGGGAFVLVYLLCIALVGIPVMMAEILLGRRGRQSPINTMRELAKEEGRSRAWSYVGWAGMVAGFLILSYYSVIAGWALSYVFKAGTGMFVSASSDQIGFLFSDMVSSAERVLAWHTIFMVMTMWVVARGVRGGLEKAVTFLMPALFVLLLLMVGYALSQGAFSEAVDFLFRPDFGKVFYDCEVVAGQEVCEFSGEPLLVAIGHAFFTLSLGMGAIMVYGSYMPSGSSIGGSTIIIALADTVVAMLAGLAIFPIVFANGLEPGSGPGLIFQTLPIAFGAMPGGQLFGTLFFLLLTFAAWSSSISIIEPVVAWLVENRGWTRVRAAAWSGVGCWLLGLGTVFSFNIWSGEEYQIFGKTVFDLFDYLTANIMLPLGGLAMALFVGWFASRDMSRSELRLGEGVFSLWWVVIRFVAPLAILVIFFHAIGVF
jgi:NSS family neurotransmitter:Na+ symporter